MKIEAGRMITEAMVAQRDRDFLSLVVFDTIVGGWNRMSKKLADKGWITPYSHANTIEEAMAQNAEALEQLSLPAPQPGDPRWGEWWHRDEGEPGLTDEPWKRPSE